MRRTTIALGAMLLIWSAAAAQEPLGPADRIQVSASDLEEFHSLEIAIGQDGLVRLPLIGPVMAGGETIPALEATIQEKLRVYLLEPLVTVRLLERLSRPVYVFGAVTSPGMRQLTRATTLGSLLTAAGGLTAEAGSTIVVRRPHSPGPIPSEGDFSGRTPPGLETFEFDAREVLEQGKADITLQPYDSIFVQRAQMVYVVGEVGAQGRIPMNERNRLTVLDAISAAGGLKPTAAASRARILRPVAGAERREELRIDVKSIFIGKADDVALLPGDILYVPDSAAKKTRNIVVSSAIQAATSILTWGAVY